MPIIYEPEGILNYIKVQRELKDRYGTDLLDRTIIEYEGIYYKFYWMDSIFAEMSPLSVWWNKKIGRIK